MRGAISTTVVLTPSSAADGGDLEADQAAADDEQVLALTERRLELLRVSFGAQVVDVRCPERQLRDFADHRAGRDHQRVVGQAVGRHGV